MNLAAARAAIAAIAKFCPYDEWRLQALEALDYLDEGTPDDGPTPSPKRPLTNAEKCARRRLREKGIEPPPRHRARHQATPSTVSRDTIATPTDTAKVSVGVAPVVSRDPDLDLPLSQRFQDFRGSGSLDTRETDDTERHRARHQATPPAPARGPAVRASDDGCFGIAVESWREGVREVTGRPITLSHGVVRHLVDVIVDNCPEIAKREEWAQTKAAAWARACQAASIVLNPYKFADWLASGETLSKPRSSHTSAETPEEKDLRSRGIAERDRERKRLDEEARAERAGKTWEQIKAEAERRRTA